MGSRNTVFILGAGASQPYGFPCGPELRKEILREFGRGGEGFKYLTSHGFAEGQQVAEFVRVFGAATSESIDEFLGLPAFRQFRNIGKLAIAWTLIPKEDPESLRAEETREHGWYDYFWNRWTQGVRETEALKNRLRDHEVSFITFNYERSIDYCLHRACKDPFALDVDEAKEVMGEIPIVHVYGQLGMLDWQHAQSGRDRRDYAKDLDPNTLRRWAYMIQILGEGSYYRPELKKARGLIKEADLVVFLGFAYLKSNLDLLEMPDIWKDIPETRQRSTMRIVGSAYNMKTGERDLARRNVGGEIQIDKDNHKVLPFLRNLPGLFD